MVYHILLDRLDFTDPDRLGIAPNRIDSMRLLCGSMLLGAFTKHSQDHSQTKSDRIRNHMCLPSVALVRIRGRDIARIRLRLRVRIRVRAIVGARVEKVKHTIRLNYVIVHMFAETLTRPLISYQKSKGAKSMSCVTSSLKSV